MPINKMKYRALADLAHSQTWRKYLKPELESIKNVVINAENDVDTIEKSAMRDIKRSNTLKIINTIIRIIENAENKIK